MKRTEKYVGIQFIPEKNTFVDVSCDVEYETEIDKYGHEGYKKAVALLEKENPEFKQIIFTNAFGVGCDILVHPNISIKTYGEMVFRSCMSITVLANNVDIQTYSRHSGNMSTLLRVLNSIVRNKSIDKYIFIDKSRTLLSYKRDLALETEEKEKIKITYHIDKLNLDLMELECVM